MFITIFNSCAEGEWWLRLATCIHAALVIGLSIWAGLLHVPAGRHLERRKKQQDMKQPFFLLNTWIQ
jgi:hypothetical protein